MATARAQQAYAYYISIGYTPVQAAGIVGNLMQESGQNLSVDVVGDSGTAFGVAQWRGDRLTALRSFAASRGTDWRDFDTQLAFVDHELKTTERRAGDLLRSATTVPDATAAMISYERPQGWTTSNPRGGHGWTTRLSYAAQLSGIDPMAYTAPAATPAAQGAINAATGPAAGLPAPAPAPGSQRLFRPISEARTAREAGGTPRLDELSSIIQQRRAGMNPLLDRLQNFFQTRQAARQQNQTAPTPPAPIPATAARPSSGGGGGARLAGYDPAVEQAQRELAAAGFDPGPIDGLMGPRTRAAMQAREAAGAMPAPTAPQGGGMPRPSIMDRTMAAVKGGVGQMQVTGPAVPGKTPAPLPRANIARPGVAAPVMGDGMVNRSYTQPTGQMAPRPVTGDGMANRQFTMPTGQMPAPAGPPPGWSPIPPMDPRIYAGSGRQEGERAAFEEEMANEAFRSLGPMLAAATPPPPPAAGGGILGPMAGPGAGGRPVSTNPTTLVANTGTPFSREDAVNRGFMPAGRDDFGLQNGFFRDLPGFMAAGFPMTTPQTPGQTALRQPVTSTTPPMPNMPLRGMPIPPWWRALMGAGV